MYEDYGDTGMLTVERYAAIGGIERVVRYEVEQALAVDLRERDEQLALLRSAFIPWLPTINPVKRPAVTARRGVERSPRRDTSHPQPLIDRRLLAKDHRDGETV
ncbi:hypothetical protein ACFYTQ_35360 [Nocardia sp. NPDC004068]|uniref:hypothetical protein n=1 Tax=Nocardia sp. NPDC004068 TaxID=3364303 RepID=UPI003698B63A